MDQQRSRSLWDLHAHRSKRLIYDDLGCILVFSQKSSCIQFGMPTQNYLHAVATNTNTLITGKTRYPSETLQAATHQDALVQTVQRNSLRSFDSGGHREECNLQQRSGQGGNLPRNSGARARKLSSGQRPAPGNTTRTQTSTITGRWSV